MAQENLINRKVQKPKFVRITMLILYGYVAIRFIIEISRMTVVSGNFPFGGFMFQLAILIIEIFIVYMISLGITWARNLWLILFLLYAGFGLWEIFPIDENFKGLILISVITYAFGVVPIIFLFLKPAREWFKASK